MVDGVDAFGRQTIQAWNPLITESPQARAVTQKYSSMKSLHAFAACVGDAFSLLCASCQASTFFHRHNKEILC